MAAVIYTRGTSDLPNFRWGVVWYDYDIY